MASELEEPSGLMFKSLLTIELISFLNAHKSILLKLAE